MYQIRISVLITLCIGLTAFAGGLSAESLVGQVIRVSSGDKIWLRVGGENRQILLYGIDAPERRQPYYSEARSFLRETLKGKTVRIILRGKGSLGLDSGMVFLEDDSGLAINQLMVLKGYAWARRDKEKIPVYLDLEKTARKNRQGLWRAKKPDSPWKFRKTGGKGCVVVEPDCD